MLPKPKTMVFASTLTSAVGGVKMQWGWWKNLKPFEKRLWYSRRLLEQLRWRKRWAKGELPGFRILAISPGYPPCSRSLISAFLWVFINSWASFHAFCLPNSDEKMKIQPFAHHVRWWLYLEEQIVHPGKNGLFWSGYGRSHFFNLHCIFMEMASKWPGLSL